MKTATRKYAFKVLWHQSGDPETVPAIVSLIRTEWKHGIYGTDESMDFVHYADADGKDVLVMEGGREVDLTMPEDQLDDYDGFYAQFRNFAESEFSL